MMDFIDTIKDSTESRIYQSGSIHNETRKYYTIQDDFSCEYQGLDEHKPPISYNDFYDLFKNYDSSYSIENRKSKINEISCIAWKTIVEQPEVIAVELKKYIENNYEKIKNQENYYLIKILIKISLRPFFIEASSDDINNNLCVTDIKELFSIFGGIEDDIFIPNNGMDCYINLVRRFIIFLLYEHPHFFKEQIIINIIEPLINIKHQSWQQFFLDIYYRCQCGNIIISDELLLILTSSCERYIEEKENRPMPKLWSIFNFPLEESESQQLDDIVNFLNEIARDCKNYIECKWCVAALQRMIPLFDDSEDSDSSDKYEKIISLIKCFDKKIYNKSPQLIAIHLDSLTRIFICKKEKKYLIEYQNIFKKYSSQLPHPLMTRLQIEYASCIYMYYQFSKSREEVIGLLFDGASGIRVDNYNDLLETSSFGNHLLKHENIELSIKKSPFTFLNQYLNALYRHFLEKRIENNHLYLRRYSALLNVYRLRLNISKSLLYSLNKYSEYDLEPNFCADSSKLFSLIPRNENMTLIEIYIRNSLCANDYSVMKNSKFIAWGLYSLYYYYYDRIEAVYEEKVRKREEIKVLSELFKERTKIGHSQSTPKLHWIYYVGIRLENIEADREFIFELHDAKIPRKTHQLKLKRDEKFDITGFCTDMNRVIKHYSDEGSILAIALKDNIKNPNVWNLIATIINDNREHIGKSALNKAAHFYSIAKCFARNAKIYDQKYCYNYIYCKGLTFKENCSIPSGFYIIDTARYLKETKSEFFGYKEKRTEVYFELLQKYWHHIEDKHRKELTNYKKKNLLNVNWICEMLNTDKYKNLKFYLNPVD